MGIPGMFGTLAGRGVFKKREHRHPAQGEVGPCVVFDDATLPILISHEWQRQPTETSASESAGYDAGRGGRETQLRAFTACYIRQLVEEYNCTIVWVRDGGVNDKPNTIGSDVFDNLARGCAEADSAIGSTGNAAHRRTFDMISELDWPMNGFCSHDDAVMEAFGACGTGQCENDVLIVSAPANCADGEVWRQARKLLHRYGNERRIFIVSSDTDMLFFRESSPDVGIVLWLPADTNQKYAEAPVVGADWSCDLFRNTGSSRKLLSFTYCTVADDVAHALGVDPKFLPILGACLGGDLTACDPSVYDVTFRIKSALVDKHFEHGSAVAQAFKTLRNEDVHALSMVSSMKARAKGTRECHNGKYCRNPTCEYRHPRGGSMWCSEEVNGGQCRRPDCHFRHTAPMAFEIAPYALEQTGVASQYPGGAIFKTWGEAVKSLADMHEKRKQLFLGVGLRRSIMGQGLKRSKDLRNIIFKKTADLVQTHGKCWVTDSGKIDVGACVRGLCQWLCSMADGDGHDYSDALTRAIRNYDIPSHEEDTLPVVLQAPTRRLETRRIRGCYLPCPYPVPSDSGYLHYVTEHLRSRLGMELGIKATVEGVQVGNDYKVRTLPSEELLEVSEMEPPMAPSVRLHEALGFRSGTDQQWLQDLDDILQGIPQSCWKSPLRALLLNLPHPQNSSSQPLLSSESVGGLKTVLLALALWQRVLRAEDITQTIPIECEVHREKVKPLQRWEMRAFISACILSWAQLQMTACPFDLLGSSGDTKSSGKAALFSSIPEKLHRRVFVLTAQFFELTNDVKEMTHMLNGSESHLSKGVDEIMFNPEAIFCLYTAVGGLQATEGMDGRVRARLVSVLNSSNTTALQPTDDSSETWTSFLDVCDRLVDLLTGTWSPTTSGADDWEDLA